MSHTPPTLYDAPPATPDQSGDGFDDLPFRAAVALAYRCARRVEPVGRLWLLAPAVYSAGRTASLAAPKPGHAAVRAAVAAAAAIEVVVDAAEGGFAATAYEAAREACQEAYTADGDGSVRRAAEIDLATLHRLRLGGRATPGEPIAWDDPRLGPLWPDGPPDWFTAAEAACRELGENPHPPAAPLSAALAARLDTRDELDRQWAEGKLDGHAGEYVISDGTTVYAHGRNLLAARVEGAAAARAANVPADRLVDYFVPAQD